MRECATSKAFELNWQTVENWSEKCRYSPRGKSAAIDLIEAIGRAGERLMRLLDSTDLRIEACFWWFEDDRWKLVLASPLVDEVGPRMLLSKVRDCIESDPEIPRQLFRSLYVVSPGDSIITLLDLAADPIPFQRFVLQESINRALVQGAYF